MKEKYHAKNINKTCNNKIIIIVGGGGLTYYTVAVRGMRQ